MAVRRGAPTVSYPLRTMKRAVKNMLRKQKNLKRAIGRARKAMRAEIEVLAQRAEDRANAANRIQVLADTTLLRACSAAQPAGKNVPCGVIVCLTQMWIQRCGGALPHFEHTLLGYLGLSLHHDHQMSIAEFSAYQLICG